MDRLGAEKLAPDSALRHYMSARQELPLHIRA